ncbi:LuxR C-terminal-related transcriptional regulator [Kitasatospora camelliae]|uniref:LuxR C-terminal-related transcriptional regulator n=1 Tax=Kitasatospora camelliae TaxID=3156397 RepID=A0AAU8JPD1_9ACTN
MNADPGRWPVDPQAPPRGPVPGIGPVLPGGDPVLAARLAVPGYPETFVRRPRLEESLSHGLSRPLTLVNGPAGAGKTLLVAHWAATAPLPGPVAWLTAEQEDDAPGVFWTYVLEALRRSGVALPADLDGPALAGAVDQAMLSRLAAHLAGRAAPVVLVVDELERIGSSAVADGLEYLVRHADGGLRLVLIGRIEPPLPLHRHRAADELAEVRAADLAFTPAETAELLRRHGLAVSDAGAQALTERTEGWAAGIRLSALASEQAADPEAYLKEFEADDGAVADFLLAEVLQAQPSRTQELLLRASVLRRVHGELADALTGRQDGGPVLAELTRVNAFVAALGHGWYRIHPLFAEILRVHLRARHPGIEADLHRRAAAWLRGDGRIEEAVAHAAAAGDWEAAASWFVGELAIGQLFHGLEAQRWTELFAGLPDGTAGRTAALVRAALALAAGDAEGGLRQLEAAEGAADQGAEDGAAALSAAFLRVRAARLLGADSMAEEAAGSAERPGDGLAEPLRRHPELPALLLTELGSVRLWAGRTEAARSALSAAARASGGPVIAPVRHRALARLALLDLGQGLPGRAEGHARQSLREAERCGLPPGARSGVAHAVLGGVAWERDDPAAVRIALDRAAATAEAAGDPLLEVELAVLRCRLLLAEGDPAAGLRALEKAAAAAGPSPWARGRLALAACAAHLAANEPAAALRALRPVAGAAAGGGPEHLVARARAHLAGADRRGAAADLDALAGPQARTPSVAVRSLLVRAELAASGGEPDQARHLVEHALATAQADRLVRPFREAGAWLRRLLRDRPGTADGHDWLPPDLASARPATGEDAREAAGRRRAARVPAEGGGEGRGQGLGAAAGPDPGTADPGVIVEPLTEREREVLQRIAQMMSTEEVAADLHLSVNTVKTHLKSINRKLCTTRRGEAVRRARRLHLL